MQTTCSLIIRQIFIEYLPLPPDARLDNQNGTENKPDVVPARVNPVLIRVTDMKQETQSRR